MQVVIRAFGRPAPQGSKRHVGNGVMVEASKYVEPWRKAVALAAKNVWQDRKPLQGPVIVDITFWVEKPKTVNREFATQTADVDKLSRAILDSISLPKFCQVIENDSNVVGLRVTKVWATDLELPGAEIVVTRL